MTVLILHRKSSNEDYVKEAVKAVKKIGIKLRVPGSSVYPVLQTGARESPTTMVQWRLDRWAGSFLVAPSPTLSESGPTNSYFTAE
jgi:hypothetical protein